MQTKDSPLAVGDDTADIEIGQENTDSIIPPQNIEPTLLNHNDDDDDNTPPNIETTLSSRDNATKKPRVSFFNQTTASTSTDGTSSRSRRLRSQSTPVGHSLFFVPEHHHYDPGDAHSEAGGDDIDEVAAMRDLIIGTASGDSSTGTGGGDGSPSSPSNHRHHHHPRVRQTTDSTMIMSNKAQPVSDLFFQPTQPKDRDNDDGNENAKNGGGLQERRDSAHIPATIHGKDAVSLLDTSHNKKPNEQGRPQSWGRGIVDDFWSTAGEHWKEEMTNLKFKTVAVSLFLFFACVAPAVRIYLCVCVCMYLFVDLSYLWIFHFGTIAERNGTN